MKKLLLVVDMQKDFIEGSLATPEAAAILPKVIEKMEKWDGDLICTLDTHSDDYLETQEGRNLPVPHCLKGTPGWELQKEVARLCEVRGGKKVEKPGFGIKNLPQLIMENYPEGLSEIHLVGLCTDICVIVNALLLKTYFSEIPIYVDSNCCAGVTPERHYNALSAMEACQVGIL
ncbi:MAG: cysteine hydrolase family protein [Anaerovoracaceae bacterium]|jgi:nicotinamidase/pyrazinamidase